MIELLLIGCLIYLFIRQRALGKEVTRLSAALEAREPTHAQTADGADTQAPPVETDSVSVATPADTATPDPVATASPIPAAAPVAASVAAEDAGDQEYQPPKQFVFGSDNMDRLGAWLKENWIYVVAALSLTMAGIFLVQYGIETGLLSPTVRVISALLFGVALIGVGDRIRRRGGDGDEDLTAFLPSLFAGAGIVTLFSAVVSARQLYGLIGPEMAFIGLIAVAAGAIALGWVYGNFLTVIGIGGAVVAPFIVGGDSTDPTWLFYYFALIGAVGLTVDALKRSAWVSVVALALPYAGALLIWLTTQSSGPEFLVFSVVLAAAATCLPMMSVRPHFSGAMLFGSLHSFGPKGWPEFPTRLAAGGILALCLVAFLVAGRDVPSFWLAVTALFAALAAVSFWLDRSPTLEDLAPLIAFAIFAVIGWHGLVDLPVDRAFANAFVGFESPAPWTITWLTGMGLSVTLVAAFKSARSTPFPVIWAFGAAAFAPLVMLSIELAWQPRPHLSDFVWAGHIAAVAAVMAVCANRAGLVDGDMRLRTALYTLAALNMVAFAMAVTLTETALTLGFVALVVSAAWLDRRFDIKVINIFVQLGIVVCGFRLIGHPGIPWAIDTSLLELVVGYVGVIGGLAATWVLLQRRARENSIIVTESALWSLIGIFITLLIYRALEDNNPGEEHWSLSLFAMVWLISAANQFYRLQIDGVMRIVRTVLGIGFAAAGLIMLFLSVTLGNPLFGSIVLGPPLFDTLLIAYAAPALLIAAVAWRFVHLGLQVRIAMAGLSAFLMALYAGLEIRRLWQGPYLASSGVLDGEQYSYTIALILLGAALLLLALLRKSVLIRKIAITVIAVTIAKVFLIDMSGLEGLIRVLSFFALGLALAGLALLNRWMTRSLAADQTAMEQPQATPDAQ
ncbi:DUF2339 domain-containing protein [Pyruvatibacter sp.]|uniref:DUF2339 domain-containing protein n=1 Tax=Pyruvatibacter sp. TaxID=1981328 RepID=UPI0032636CE9